MNKAGLLFPSAFFTQIVDPISVTGTAAKVSRLDVIAVFVLLNKVTQFAPSKT